MASTTRWGTDLPEARATVLRVCTQKEVDAFRLKCSGMGARQIARALGISTTVAKARLANVERKLLRAELEVGERPESPAVFPWPASIPVEVRSLIERACTPKEIEVLQLKAMGYGRARMALRLGISGEAVRDRLRRAVRKLEAQAAADGAGPPWFE